MSEPISPEIQAERERCRQIIGIALERGAHSDLIAASRAIDFVTPVDAFVKSLMGGK